MTLQKSSLSRQTYIVLTKDSHVGYGFQAFCCFISYSACSGTSPHTRRHTGPLGLVGRCNETHLVCRHYPGNESGLSAVEGWQSHDTSYTPPGGERGIKIALLAKRHQNQNT